MEIYLTIFSTFFMIVLSIIQTSIARKRAELGKDVQTIEGNIARLHREIDANLARINELTAELRDHTEHWTEEPTEPPVEYKTPNDLLTELGYQRIQRPARFDAEGKYLEN